MKKIIDWYNFAAIIVVINLAIFAYSTLTHTSGIGIKTVMGGLAVLFTIVVFMLNLDEKLLYATGAVMVPTVGLLHLIGRADIASGMIEIALVWIVGGLVIFLIRTMERGQNKKKIKYRDFFKEIEGKIDHLEILKTPPLEINNENRTPKKSKFSEKNPDWLGLIMLGAILVAAEQIVAYHLLNDLGVETGVLSLLMVMGIGGVLIFSVMRNIDPRLFFITAALSMVISLIGLLMEEAVLSEQLSIYVFFWLGAGMLLSWIKHSDIDKKKESNENHIQSIMDGTI